MHVLTKIFIVLVSLLAVFLVPLVVVYAHNEDSYRARYDQAVSRSNAQEAQLKSTIAETESAIAQANQKNSALDQQISDLRKQRDGLEAGVLELKAELAAAKNMQGQINVQLAKLAASSEAGQRLTETLVADLKMIRSEALENERRVVDLEDTVRDVNSQLEVANAARRAALEELTRLQEQSATAQQTISRYVQIYGELEGAVVAGRVGEGIAPDRNLVATVINVRRNSDMVLAEINVGARDGVKANWEMIISDGQGNFVGNLRILDVDINQSTGVITLENPSTRGLVEVGHTAYAKKGHD
ncbi:MAG: hypothetical protein KDA25_04565 [Phycisphaerales bacterium]|nr:hypothetical protein [Phycisphaerales bacterium]